MLLIQLCVAGWLLSWTVLLIYVRQIIHKVVCFIAINVGLAILYLTYGASFLGIIQLILYVGGALVLITYVLMLTPPSELTESRQFSIGPALLVLLLVATIFKVLEQRIALKDPLLQQTLKPNLNEIGKAMMYEHAIFLEIIGLALLISLVGIVHMLAKNMYY